MKILVGISLYFSFSAILWLSTEIYFSYTVAASSTRGLTSALLDTFAFVILTFITGAVLYLFWGKPEYRTAFLGAAVIWTVGWFLMKSGMPRGDNFRFFAYGQTLIENGKVTESGYAIYTAILFSRITTLIVVFCGATLISSYILRNAQW